MIKGNRYEYHKMKTFPKAAINGLTKLFSSARFSDSYCNRDRVIQTKDAMGLKQVDYLYESRAQVLHFAKARKITKEQTQFGKAWLKSWFYKLDGSIRNGKRTENVPQVVLQNANKISRFEFIGVLGLENSMGEVVQYIPIYRAFRRDGWYFDYAPIFWGSPVICTVGGAQ